MDIFCEYIVKRKKTIVDFLIIIGGYFAAFLLSVIFILTSQYTLGMWLLLIALVWFGAFILAKTRYIEFEYILTNNELDIDRIFAKSRRKRLLTVDFKNIDICAKIDNPNFANEFKNAPEKIYDCSGICDNDTYFVDFYTNEKKTRVIFQPTEKMLENIRLINPRAVHIL